MASLHDRSKPDEYEYPDAECVVQVLASPFDQFRVGAAPPGPGQCQFCGGLGLGYKALQDGLGQGHPAIEAEPGRLRQEWTDPPALCVHALLRPGVLPYGPVSDRSGVASSDQHRRCARPGQVVRRSHGDARRRRETPRDECCVPDRGHTHYAANTRSRREKQKLFVGWVWPSTKYGQKMNKVPPCADCQWALRSFSARSESPTRSPQPPTLICRVGSFSNAVLGPEVLDTSPEYARSIADLLAGSCQDAGKGHPTRDEVIRADP